MEEKKISFPVTLYILTLEYVSPLISADPKGTFCGDHIEKN